MLTNTQKRTLDHVGEYTKTKLKYEIQDVMEQFFPYAVFTENRLKTKGQLEVLSYLFRNEEEV